LQEEANKKPISAIMEENKSFEQKQREIMLIKQEEW